MRFTEPVEETEFHGVTASLLEFDPLPHTLVLTPSPSPLSSTQLRFFTPGTRTLASRLRAINPMLVGYVLACNLHLAYKLIFFMFMFLRGVAPYEVERIVRLQ